MAEAGNTLDRVTQWLERAVHGPHPWWLWPSALVFLASICIGAAIFVYPDYDDPTRVMWLGQMFGGECGMKTALGIPCPQCGMTRSWVYLVRGQVLDAFTFNAAGALLLIWIASGGVVGAIRLVTGRERALNLPWALLFAWAMFWVFVPYMGLWIARIMGFNMLPEYL